MELSVCHVIDNLTQGGAQSLVKDIATHSPDTVDQTVCALGHDMTMADQFQDANIEILPCRGSFRFDPRALYRLYRYLNIGSFDIVHAHLAYAQTFARLLTPFSRSGPVVSTYHDAPQTYCRDWHMRLAEKLTRPLDTVSIGVSSSVAKGFASTFYFRRGKEMEIIDNGIDVDALRSRLATVDGDTVRNELGLTEEPMFLNVGRLAPKKRQRDLIEAMALLNERDQKGHLVVVGGGELEDDLRACVKKQNVTDRVTITGRVPDVEPYYAAADVYVHAALYEGWPLTLAEALTAELPVIAPDVPGTADVIGDAGILVSPQSPTELAAAMAELDNEDERQRLAARSLSRAERCHIENTVKQYVTLYREISD